WWAWVVIAVIVVASVGALLSMLRVWRKVFWGKTMQHQPAELRVSGRLLAPSVLLMVGSVAMFLLAGPLIDATLTSTAGLLDVTGYSAAILGENPVGVPDLTDLQGGR